MSINEHIRPPLYKAHPYCTSRLPLQPSTLRKSYTYPLVIACQPSFNVLGQIFEDETFPCGLYMMRQSFMFECSSMFWTHTQYINEVRKICLLRWRSFYWIQIRILFGTFSSFLRFVLNRVGQVVSLISDQSNASKHRNMDLELCLDAQH